MKLYHGSPKKLKIIKPIQAKGLTKFENQKAIFLCRTFKHASLYAIGKTLKGKTSFALSLAVRFSSSHSAVFSIFQIKDSHFKKWHYTTVGGSS